LRFKVSINGELKLDLELDGHGVLSCMVEVRRLVDKSNASIADASDTPILRRVNVFGRPRQQDGSNDYLLEELEIGDEVQVSLMPPTGRVSGCSAERDDVVESTDTNDEETRAGIARVHIVSNRDVWPMAGIGKFGLLNAIVTWVWRSQSSVDVGQQNKARPFVEEEAQIDVGGIDAELDHFVNWGSEPVVPGDSFVIRVGGPGEFDSPVAEWSCNSDQDSKDLDSGQ